jgi:hypothetical protein
VRYLIYSLIIANLLYFGWSRTLPEQQPEPVRAAPLPSGVERLVLLSERSVSAPEGPADAGATQAQRQAVVQKSAKAGEADGRPDSEQAETPVASTGAATGTEQAPRVCQTVGPLLKKAAAESAAALLDEQGFKPRVREGEVQEPAGYWVYMPSMKAAEARRIVADLDANGMKDYFIGKQNYISLGIFSDRDKARTRLERVNQIGYQAILDQRYRTRAVYWLDIEERGQALTDSAVWRNILARHSDIRMQKVACE